MPDQDEIDRLREANNRLREANRQLEDSLEFWRDRSNDQAIYIQNLQQSESESEPEPEPEPVATWGALTLTGAVAQRHLAQNTPEESEATAEQTRQRLPVRLRVRNAND